MGKITYKLKVPILGWARGETLIYDDEWSEWSRNRTGEVYNMRTDIKTGEIVILLATARELESIMVKI